MASRPHTIVVSPGQSIQAAVNKAKPGDTILVEAGTYNENVVVTTDMLTIRGEGAARTKLLPPASDSGCGICIFGQGQPFGKVIRKVVGDRVSDLTTEGFAFAGVFGYGTDGMEVTHVDAVNNAEYGISRFKSIGTLFAFNRAWGSHEAGFYIGDSPDANTLVIGNQAWNNDLGFFVRHAHGVTLTENRAWANCFGMLILDDGQTRGAGNITVSNNNLSNNTSFCPGSPQAPPHGGGGVVLLGAVHTQVFNNDVNGNNISDPTAVGRGGIVLMSAAPFGGSAPMSDTVKENDARHNTPNDIVWDGSGTGNRFVGNSCGSSSPPHLCE
jgi:hypothetical protein